MHISIEVVQQHLEWPAIRDRVRFAEEAGFDGAWVFDHFRPISGDADGPCLEGWTLLAALSASTTRIRLGTLVTGMTYRHPSILAAEAITVDQVSDGRLEIGLGAAWFDREHRQLGLDFPSTQERTQRLEEGIAVMKLLMTRDHATFRGQHYRLEDATYAPHPVQQPHPPIWIGAQGERLMLPIVARQADVWHASADLRTMLHKSRVLDELAAQAGRNPASIARAGSIRLSDPFDDVRRTAQAFRGAGFSRLVSVWPDGGIERITEFADSILPELQRL